MIQTNWKIILNGDLMFPILYEVLIIEDSHLTTFYYLKQNK